MSFEQLLSLSTDEIDAIFKHKKVLVENKNGESESFYVKNLSLASNPPHLFVGFILENGHHYGMENIMNIEVL